ncbi:esterase [Serinicoccus chungangensis]|uniref:Esterase n=1 Tax=Serinicoccus chungangensis TaxID=767452 RepID=A0A0W8I735_9MICO|nr:alpha/beta hydrolase family protein [Serinicoccus chungangensis]KUG54338.1 esterase [Serinicoccus chungangensis]
MALIRCDFFSDALELSTSMTVVLPQRVQTRIGTDEPPPSDDSPPVLYLLHGLSDDDTIWSRRTSIERYAEALGLAVVMPAVHRSFYTDMRHGGRYWTFVSEELPTVASQLFRVSTERERTFVAGLSMGGYGALQLALRQPERFAAAASLSGALDLGDLVRRGDRDETLRLVLGDDPVQGTPGDLLHLLDEADPQALPRLFVACGTQDVLLGHSERFVARARDRGVDVTESYAPADHTWDYWDAVVQEVLAWLPLDSRAGG